MTVQIYEIICRLYYKVYEKCTKTILRRITMPEYFYFGCYNCITKMSNLSSEYWPKCSPWNCHTPIQELIRDILVLHTSYVIREALSRAQLTGRLESVLQSSTVKMVPDFTIEYHHQMQFSCRFQKSKRYSLHLSDKLTCSLFTTLESDWAA
jgi:hypothetical protein